MDRILTISLSLSVAAHLAIGGLATQYEQNNTTVSNSLSITLNPVTAVSSKPESAKPVPATNIPNRVAEAPKTTALIAVAEQRPTRSATQQQDTPAQQQATSVSPPQPSQQEQVAIQTITTSSIQQLEPQQTDDSQTRQQIQQGLHRLLDTHFYYPRIAQRRGMEGIVHIGLHISANGEITDIHLANGSGTDILDSAALKSAKKITVYPESIELLKGQEFDVIMPVKFQLTNG